MKSWYILTTKFSVMIPEPFLSEFAPEPKAGWEEKMFSWDGNNPVHPAVATQDSHAVWYCTLAYKNTISHPATSGISSCSLAHLYIVGKLRVTELPPPKPRPDIFLWYRGQEAIAPLWLVYPESALNDPMVAWCRREQGTPSSERSSWTDLFPSVPLIKSLWGNTSVFTESKWSKQRGCSLPCGCMWDATTVSGQGLVAAKQSSSDINWSLKVPWNFLFYLSGTRHSTSFLYTSSCSWVLCQ